jgi:hypothetical protein
LLSHASMHRALLFGLALGACGHASSTTGQAVGQGFDRALWCAASYAASSRSGTGCQPRPPTVGVTLRGQVVVAGATGPLPLAFTKVVLLREARVVATAASDGRGRFSFTDNLDAGDYEIALAPGDYTGGTTLTVDRGTPDVVVFATRQ